MDEMLSKIPIYCEDWTNYNISDPGITMLEYLAAFQILQQEQMDIVSDPVKYKLLELLGYTPAKGRGAKVYIEPKGMTSDITIPADQRFLVGNISFETTLARDMTSAHLTGIYLKDDEEIQSLQNCIRPDMFVDTYIFTDKPRTGMELYLVMDKAITPGQEAILSVTTNPSYRRNPKLNLEYPKFIEWEYYTEDGFVPLEMEDGTEGMLVDGLLKVTMPEKAASKYSDGEIEGFVFRARLISDTFDLAPSVRHISGFLFPAVQKETLVIAYSFQKADSLELNCAMLEDNYIKVFVKEEKGSSYRMYEQTGFEPEQGRFYKRERTGYGQFIFSFDEKEFGYGPANVKNAIKIVIYNEEMMRKYYLGEVYGYDNQEIRLPKSHVLSETFALMAERTDENGQKLYDFVRPGKMGEHDLSYCLLENDGRIVILDAGDYIGAKLYIAGLAVTLGEEGNVRAGNTFVPYGYRDKIVFTNPIAGSGGCYKEKLEDVRRRFIKSLNEPRTAVLESDYIRLVKQAPGLCISKVNAWMDQDKNLVQIVVLPKSRDKQPKLSETYKWVISEWMEDKRLISTRLNVCQPKYAAVLTSGTIYIKPHHEGARQRIEAVINEALDYVNGPQQFGELLSFEKLFHSLESLDCVAYIHELSLLPQKNNHARLEGSDVKPNEDCLLVPGHIKIDLITAKENAR